MNKNDFAQILTEEWDKINQKECGTIVCLFTDANERNLYSKQFRTQHKDKTVEYNDARFYGDRCHRIYFKIADSGASCGIGGVSSLIFYNLTLPVADIEQCYCSFVPTLLEDSRVSFYAKEEYIPDSMRKTDLIDIYKL